MAGAAVGAIEATGSRVDSMLAVAGAHGTGLALEELVGLLPESAPTTADTLARWLKEHRPTVGLADGRAFERPGLERGEELALRRARGERYLGQARRLVSGPLGPIAPWLLTVSVTGSAAFGEPAGGDDLDFFVVTRDGSLWLALACLYLALRRDRARTGEPEGHPCFNLVLDEVEARRTFGREGDFLFAREALAARPVLGERYYRGLIGGARWMRELLPRLFESRVVDGALPRSEAAPWPVRLANGLVFPWLAAYLQMQGLVRNHRFRRRGALGREFRTVTRGRRLAFESARYEKIRSLYAAVPASGGGDPT